MRSLILDLGSHGENNSDGIFPLFHNQGAWKLAPELALIIRHLVREGSFPACWRLADVVLLPKESSSSDVGVQAYLYYANPIKDI